ncbi:cbb3-type cytochrome oxidase assembly protein CcoS [Photobacterium kishitanii]|uniref:cbb3-type cytochrome oxidase assembly protein CcoS n=1 Tax=Photobacterium kishitanii TaxID=318456 RepID=UPI000D16D180|nr:cbb3-type cytochrome oxidase assembly protein CcoS [Photobacterium kishitanii]PSV16063.1 cbb3-type cytochrome oxidase assembly protein CcoS [Photobacterium kishitanii]
MSILYILIPIALVFVCLAITVFLWAVKTNQFDDLERRGYDILFDDDLEKPQHSSKTSSKKAVLSSNSSHDRT